jgi:hypothetical protein
MNYYNYFTEIEEHFVRRRGKHLYVSPLDWSLIATWRDSGVPLHVALRGIDIAMDGFFAKTHRIKTKVNTLFFCHDAVMAEHARHLDAHQGEAATEGERVAEDAPSPESDGTAEQAAGPSKLTILGYLSARLSEIKSLRAKQSGREDVIETLDRVLLRLEEIAQDLEGEQQIEMETVERDLAILDELLTDRLREAAGAGQIQEWESEAKKDLKVYKKRLPKETYEKILGNYIRGRVRARFEIGELSLFHL